MAYLLMHTDACADGCAVAGAIMNKLSQIMHRIARSISRQLHPHLVRAIVPLMSMSAVAHARTVLSVSIRRHPCTVYSPCLWGATRARVSTVMLVDSVPTQRLCHLILINARFACRVKRVLALVTATVPSMSMNVLPIHAVTVVSVRKQISLLGHACAPGSTIHARGPD